MSHIPAGTIESVDPGEHTGWAYFYAGLLDECTLWNLDRKRLPGPFSGRVVVIENQVIHRDTRRPEDIITLAHTAGRIAERMGWHRVEWVDPHTWKRNVDPDIMCERIIQCLTDEERRVYFTAADLVAESYRHNIIDAIGIGLWKLRRLPK